MVTTYRKIDFVHDLKSPSQTPFCVHFSFNYCMQFSQEDTIHISKPYIKHNAYNNAQNHVLNNTVIIQSKSLTCEMLKQPTLYLQINTLSQAQLSVYLLSEIPDGMVSKYIYHLLQVKVRSSGGHLNSLSFLGLKMCFFK